MAPTKWNKFPKEGLDKQLTSHPKCRAQDQSFKAGLSTLNQTHEPPRDNLTQQQIDRRWS
ncbi:hypothetical protein N7533_004070 [Penicillium manginii]|uniref:uncharacterized protein n=1 Tax=Penicillium manginii TaxID=203109 RepID=UPI002547A5DC|nr:uncharacterized protein N7533_004070 [Penicillium manginii]KAJ5754527.1 hypothetical protein N7533_004070 [Penicillium manginii]